MVNPAFVVKGWGERPARIRLNGQEIRHREGAVRLGHRRTLDGTDLIVWLRGTPPHSWSSNWLPAEPGGLHRGARPAGLARPALLSTTSRSYASTHGPRQGLPVALVGGSVSFVPTDVIPAQIARPIPAQHNPEPAQSRRLLPGHQHSGGVQLRNLGKRPPRVVSARSASPPFERRPPASRLRRRGMGANPTWVRAWHEPLVIPTYTVGPPDRDPMFLEKRVYQGSSGKVYPLPFTDRISETKTDRAWKAILAGKRISAASWSCRRSAAGSTSPRTRPTATTSSIGKP